MAKQIPLTKGMFAIVDDEDFPRLSSLCWHAASHGSRGQLCAATGHRSQLMHRMIMNAAKGQFVDHINGDPLDNRRSNLRFCTRQQNQHNRRSVSNRYGVKGVRQTKYGKFFAQIRIDGRLKHLGMFETKDDAARAYDAAALNTFGKFAATNQELGLIKGESK